MNSNSSKIEHRRGQDAKSIQWGFAEHLKYTLAVDRYTSDDHKRFMAMAYAIRDRLINQWLLTQRTHHDKETKRVYYLSLEFLIGRAMGSNAINTGMEQEIRQAMNELGYSWEELREQEVDAGLGNGGLGRLAACFLDSMATLDLPAFGYGLRYDYGIFRQKIDDGYQIEYPDDWLRYGNPWEIKRPDVAVPVHFGGHVITVEEAGRLRYRWIHSEEVRGIAYDIPIVGYGGKTVNTLRLWSAGSGEEFDFQRFNDGEYIEAVSDKVAAENLTKVLYPNDTLYLGKELRLKQQYFFVACSLWDIVRRFKKSNLPWKRFPEKAAIQLNDTHPSLAVPELMRLLVDKEGLVWDEAWDITVKTLGYTNHTLMPEALEKWSVHMMEKILPRHLQIIYKINHDFLQQVANRFPDEPDRLRTMSLIEEGSVKQVRMAYLSIVGSHSTNGVAELHTDLLKSRLVPEFAQMFPERFNNKTNGITQRRFLLKANPGLSALISEKIGNGWITDFSQLKKLERFADDADFQQRFLEIKRENKNRLAQTIRRETGWALSTESMFDVQVKRIHEYKRQLLNALHVVMLYNRIRAGEEVQPRTVLFAGKAAPGYKMAKLIIKLINNISEVVNNDPLVSKQLQVYFIPNYRVSLAEKIFPATDVSQQISTAGTEASGTGNMKFMANGAITLGTLDGANIEILEEVGQENCVIFGLTADEVNQLRPTYSPQKYYEENPEIKAALDLLFSGHFNADEPGLFDAIRAHLLEKGDYYMHLADLASYAEAQRAIERMYQDKRSWARKAILNIANAGKFSSDRTIAEYAKDIWNLQPCPIDFNEQESETLNEARLYSND
jgi:starch phosphorylase